MDIMDKLDELDERSKELDISWSKQDKHNLSRNILIALVVIAAGIVILLFPQIKLKKQPIAPDFSGIDTICELATLECYYHNVVEYEKQPDGLFQYGLFQYGYKKMWMEYEGIIKVGIDVNEVQVEQPDENNVVRITIPSARIMDVDVDPYSMSDPIVDTGILTTITTEEKSQAFVETQKAMRESAERDGYILSQAQENAKKLLKQYVIKVGEQIGQNYTVEFISAISEEPQAEVTQS